VVDSTKQGGERYSTNKKNHKLKTPTPVFTKIPTKTARPRHSTTVCERMQLIKKWDAGKGEGVKLIRLSLGKGGHLRG